MTDDIELRHLRAFVAVAEHLHFGKAAQQLHLAQPALSQRIRQMEDLLGHRLFLRTSRAVALTPAGEVLLQRSRRSLQSLHADLQEVCSVARGEMGSLNVGFIGSGMLTSLPSVLERYRKQYPRVRMQLHESFTSQVLRGLSSGELDAGLVRDSDPVPGLHREALFTERFVAVVPAHHSLAGCTSVHPAQLAKEPFVFYARTAGALAYDKPLTLSNGDLLRPRVVQTASNWLTILQLIGAGLGVSIAPACVRAIANTQIVCLPLVGSSQRSVIELVFRQDETRPIVLQFAQLARLMAKPGAKAKRTMAASKQT